MAQSGWDEQFRDFLKRAGDDLKRMGEEIRTEAHRLVAQVQDPEKQQTVRTKAREVRVWAKQAAGEVADLVEKGAGKAESALRNYARPSKAEKSAAPAPAPKKKPAAKVKKTVGPKKKAPAAKAAPQPAKKAAPRKKPMGPASGQ